MPIWRLLRLLRASINMGNETINCSLPLFNDCKEEAVNATENAPHVSYFENEPTKNELIICYQELLVDDSIA